MSSQVSNEILNEFLIELDEMLERISVNLASLEKKSDQKDLVRSIYRDIHTIKGNAMMFGLPLTGKLTHSIENILEYLRENQSDISSDVGNLIFNSLDFLHQISESLKKYQREPDIQQDIDSCVIKFEDVLSTFYKNENTVTKIDEIVPVQENKNHAHGPLITDTDPTNSNSALDVNPSKVETQTTQNGQESIRVHVHILDNLLNTVGELVLIRNRIQQRSKFLSEEDIQISQQLSIITSELQNEVMKTRMQPVGSILTKFYRVARDLAVELRKEINLTLSGVETELDRALLEAIRDPIMHIFRNCADHGIESSEERLRKGKVRTGQIRINALHEGGQVIIEIIDDGRGLDRAKIRDKAIQKGLIKANQSKDLSDDEIIELIFMPGFSTADSISNVSGRGVGMDVVKSNIEKVGGTVEVKSDLGIGTRTILKIPLTLAIIPAIVVRILHCHYTIPQDRIVELLQIQPDRSDGFNLEYLEGKPFIRSRGNLIPVLFASEIFMKNKRSNNGFVIFDEGPKTPLSLVILNSEGNLFGLAVDEIVDSTDIVVKPLGSILEGVRLFSGAAILGDGTIALTIDVAGVADNSKIKDSLKDSNGDQKIQITASQQTDEIDYLLVQLNEPGNFAIPLGMVNRLEDIETKNFHWSGKSEVCLYRDSLLPILPISDALGLKKTNATSDVIKVSLIVVSRGERLFGLKVSSIIDILTSSAQIDSEFSDRKGIIGGFVHDQDVYTVLDIYEMIDHHYQQQQSSPTDMISRTENSIKKRQVHQILLAEDNQFFRRQIVRVLQDSGYRVTSVEDGAKAWELLQESGMEPFSLILSDIEMPHMDGLDLARNIRLKSAIPLVAITTKYSKAAISHGLEAGFNHYLEKLNQSELISKIDQILEVQSA